jgi:hypothetical protein
MNINGQIFDAQSIKLMWPTGYVSLLEDIDYSDEQERETIYDINNRPKGQGRGKYKADCKITVGMSEYEQLNIMSARYGGLYNMPPMPIVVNYTNDSGLTVTDKITVTFKKRGKKGKKGDKELHVPLECEVIGPIIWNGVPAYTPT